MVDAATAKPRAADRTGGRQRGDRAGRTRLDRPQVHVGALVVLGAAMSLPYAIAGPALLRDDWFTIRNARLDRWWMAAGSDQWAARPIASVVYALTFGLVGDRPLIHHVLAATLVTVTAVVLYVVASRFLGRWASLAVAATWLLQPNHTSLEMWPSALNICLALLLLLLGIERLTHPEQTPGKVWAAASMFAIGLLAYEAIGPLAAVAVVAVGFLRPSGQRLRTALPPLLLLGSAGLWMVANWHPEKKGLATTIDPWLVVPGHFGYSITGDLAIASVAVPAVVLIASAVAGYRLILEERRRTAGWPEWALLAGWSIVVLGTVPFVRYFYSPIGFGDRVTVVSGVGGAVVFVAVTALLWRWRRSPAWAFAALLVIAMVVQRASMVGTYATAADDSRRVLAAIEERWPVPPAHPMVFGPEVVDRHVRAFEPMEYPVQVLYGTKDVEVRDAFDVREFERSPRAHRFDLRIHSKLDDGRLRAP